MLQSRNGSLALTKKDLIFLFALYASIGHVGKELLKYFSRSNEGQYFLIILIALDAEGLYLVTKEILFIDLLFLGLSSNDLSRNLTLLVCRSMNLWEYPLFCRFILCLAFSMWKVSIREFVRRYLFISPVATPLLAPGGVMGLSMNVCLSLGH